MSPIDEQQKHLLQLLSRLNSEWTTLDSENLSRADAVSHYLLCAAGWVELKVRGQAWTDNAALDFEAAVCGLWLDMTRKSLLSGELRKAVPAWQGKPVAVQLVPVLHTRLTPAGRTGQSEVSGEPKDAVLLLAFLTRHPIRGSVRLRILGNAGPPPGAVADDTVANTGIVQALNDVTQPIGENASPAKPAQIANPGQENSDTLPQRAPSVSEVSVPPIKSESVKDESADLVAGAGGPQPDPGDSRKVLWAGKSIYLGHETAASRLFWLLARPVGSAHTLEDVQRTIDGFTALQGTNAEEIRKARQRVRKEISQLRRALYHAELDDHVMIVRGGSQKSPDYSMIWRYPG